MASLNLSIIMRVENVPWTANALDIRKYFSGLNIPEGGVHIIGGERGIAYVAFQTVDDLNKAMQLNGGIINNSQINLMESSRAEMAEILEKIRTGKLNMAAQLFPKSVKVPTVASSRLPYTIKNFHELDSIKKQTINCQSREKLEPANPILSHPNGNISYSKYEKRPKFELKNWYIELRNLQNDITHESIMAFVGEPKTVSQSDIILVPWMGRALIRLNGSQSLKDSVMLKNGLMLSDKSVEVVEVTSKEFSLAEEAIRDAAKIAAVAVGIPASRQSASESPEPPGISKSPPQLPAVSTEYVKLTNLPLQYQWHNIRALFPSARIAKDGLRLDKDEHGHFTGVAFLRFANLEECGKALERLCTMKYDVTLLTREEFERGISVSEGRSSSTEPSYNPNYRYVAVKNIEESTSAEKICGIFQGLEVNSTSDVVFLSGRQVALVRLKSEHDQQSALRRNRSILGCSTVIVEPATHADFEQAFSHATFPQVGPPGCNIMLHNLNPSMDQEEVMSLLQPFQPLPDTLRLHYDESGKATGRAIVAFARPELAQQAFAELDGKDITEKSLMLTVY